MSGKNKIGEASTLEMETKENFNQILEAINGLRQDFSGRMDKLESRMDKLESRMDKLESRMDKFESVQNEIKNDLSEFKSFSEVQFEAIRQGIVKNYNQFDRLESQIAENRAVIFSTKAVLGELHERVYLLTRSTENALK